MGSPSWGCIRLRGQSSPVPGWGPRPAEGSLCGTALRRGSWEWPLAPKVPHRFACISQARAHLGQSPRPAEGVHNVPLGRRSQLL